MCFLISVYLYLGWESRLKDKAVEGGWMDGCKYLLTLKGEVAKYTV